MYYLFNKSSRGYSHVDENKPCQDYSSSYQDMDRIIITCADGHGGERYIRSDVGAKLACKAVFNVLSSLKLSKFRGEKMSFIYSSIKLSILCEWNNLVNQALKEKPIRKSEVAHLDAEDLAKLKQSPESAYGTTCTGAMAIGNKIFVIALGDTEAMGVKNGQLVPLFNEEDEPVANYTYSMCSSDAYEHIKVAILDSKYVDGIILCTDGFVAPYRTISEFSEKFIRTDIKNMLLTHSTNKLDELVYSLADHSGVGDDVSLAFFFKKDINPRRYR